uniref:Isochorismatase-like domain-containing protein n=1 Tax=Bionectria ochroleuca TaxID=29856 RepID=A0A8H7N2S9_BIOOC
MATQSSSQTGIVLIDPYNDFLHHDGKLNPAVRESLTTTDTNKHLKTLVDAARDLHIPIFYAMHQEWKEGNYQGWSHLSTSNSRLNMAKAFEKGTWGQSFWKALSQMCLAMGIGFVNTDLNYQLRQRGITHLVMAGMVANTCLESTARDARELGFHVTLLSDGTAGFTGAQKDAATDLIWPLIVEKVMKVDEWVKEARQSQS